MATKQPNIITNNKPDNMTVKNADIFGVVFRYAILIFLYLLTLVYISTNSVQFIMYIVLFILNFFFIVFLFKDLLSNPAISKALYQSPSGFNFGEPYGMIKIFISIIFLALVMQIVSIAIILVVFDYGKTTTNNYLSYEMTPPNMIIITTFKENIMWTTILIAMLSYILILSCAEGKAKGFILNIMSIILSCVVIAVGSYGIYISTTFLKIKENGQQLYQ